MKLNIMFGFDLQENTGEDINCREFRNRNFGIEKQKSVLTIP